ncbi:MAG: hypothetical protein WCE42_07440 [Rhizobium ruizarguesonis]
MQKAVLVVEDEALIRFVAVDVLEDDGYVVYEAGSVLEAVGILSSRRSTSYSPTWTCPVA